MKHPGVVETQNGGSSPGYLPGIVGAAWPRVLVALVIGEVLALSLLHHFANFWEWNTLRQLVVAALAGTACTVAGMFLLTPLWADLRSVARRRWTGFLIPAMLISSAVSWQVFRTPETEHRLSIAPELGSTGAKVRIREIRAAYGNIVDLAQLTSRPGWSLQDGLLTTTDAQASPLQVQFRGPVGEQVRVSFITTDAGGAAEVDLDGRAVTIDLRGPEGNETRTRTDTLYRWGALNFAFLPWLALIDGLATLALLAAIWVAHELGIARRLESRTGLVTQVHPHAAGLAAVCSVAVLLHAWSFVTVPLRVTKDGPSYLQGGLYFAEHGSFEGASPYRGPAFTLLFAPSFSLFGRNPLGVKLTLHLLAIGCVPLAYAIGWSLGNRHWVALASGLLTALSPDLYAYSSDVLSEVPHIFSLLLFGATLLNALRRHSFPAALACMLSGTVAVLVRPDNMAAFALGVVFLLLPSLFSMTSREGVAGRHTRTLPRLRDLLIAGAIAALPLLGWSAHNLRVQGFFGISNYFGAVLYDGWIYYGENSGIPILDRDSNAVREIDAAVPIMVPAGEQQTGPTIGYALLDHGYTGDEAFALLARAAVDSIRRNPDRALKILLLKLRKAPVPQATLPVSLAAPDEKNPYAALTRQYFDPEPWLVSWRDQVELWQRLALQRAYAPFYMFWLAFGVLSIWLGFYRRPAIIWLAYVALTTNALVLPLVVGLESWRYLIPSIILSGPLAFAALDALGGFAGQLLSRRAHTSSRRRPDHPGANDSYGST